MPTTSRTLPRRRLLALCAICLGLLAGTAPAALPGGGGEPSWEDASGTSALAFAKGRKNG